VRRRWRRRRDAPVESRRRTPSGIVEPLAVADSEYDPRPDVISDRVTNGVTDGEPVAERSFSELDGRERGRRLDQRR
jgi:hypothetical protein